MCIQIMYICVTNSKVPNKLHVLPSSIFYFLNIIEFNEV